MQPLFFNLGARNTLQMWFSPELGSGRCGFFGVHAPTGFDFGKPCQPRPLPREYYASFAPPKGVSPERVYPLEDVGNCFSAKPPSWNARGVYVLIEVIGTMIPGRLYGLEIDIVNAPVYDPKYLSGRLWSFDMSIVDAKGYGRDSTYDPAPFQPGFGPPWQFYQQNVLGGPIAVDIKTLLPYAMTNMQSVITFGPIILNTTGRVQLRVTAPVGWEWAYVESDAANTFIYSSVDAAQTAELPSGRPSAIKKDTLNVMEWPWFTDWKANELYYFRTLIRVPEYENVTSGQAFWFEWNYNASVWANRTIASRAPVDPIRALRNAYLESSSTLVGTNATIWLAIETVTRIEPGGSLQVTWPYHTVTMHSEMVSQEWLCKVFVAKEYGSDPLPSDLRCKQILFRSSATKDGHQLGDAQEELRLEFSANESGIDPGYYVFELNVTNQNLPEVNPVNSRSDCGYQGCLTWFSKQNRFESFMEVPATSERWISLEDPVDPYIKQNDYRTSIGAGRQTTSLGYASILNLTLDERLACGRNDQPLQRSALVIAFELKSFTPRVVEELVVRAAAGWEFDSDCGFWTDRQEVFPAPAVFPSRLGGDNGTAPRVVNTWPSSARIVSCRGDKHLAVVKILPGLLPRKLYLFRIELKRNPEKTPTINTWTLTLGMESSGAVPGFEVWTFPGIYLEPVLLSWSNKSAPLSAPVGIYFSLTNWLYYWSPPLARNPVLLPPIMRILLPPHYEFLIAAADQDMQGEICNVIIQQEGICRLCGVPVDFDRYVCRREWNRKNVAVVTFTNLQMEYKQDYSMWVNVINPHVPDAIDYAGRPWIVETFFGLPAPPAIAPEGYWLDTANVSGFTISGQAGFTVTFPEERNGSAFVDFMPYSVSFPDLLLPGDVILIQAPLGYETSYTVVGFTTVVTCHGFEWLPTIWDDPLPDDVDAAKIPFKDLPLHPPMRPPLPNALPPWAAGTRVIDISPTLSKDIPTWAADGAWVMRLPLDFNQVVRFEYYKFLENITSNTSNASNLNLTAANFTPPTMYSLFLGLGLPRWALAAAAGAQEYSAGTATRNASYAYLVLRSHCLEYGSKDARGNTLFGDGDFDWSKVPATANFSAYYMFDSYDRYANGTLKEVMALPSNVTNATNLTNSSNMSNGTNSSASSNASNSSNSSNSSNATNATNSSLADPLVESRLCLMATFMEARYNIDQVAGEAHCRKNCTVDGVLNTNCIVDCLFTPIAWNVTRCSILPQGQIPDASDGIQAQLLPAVSECGQEIADYLMAVHNASNGSNFSNFSNGSSVMVNQTYLAQLENACKCSKPGDRTVAVLWRSEVNLTQQMDTYRAKYEAARRLRDLDMRPLQAIPRCVDNKVYLTLRAEDMHPDARYLNGSMVFNFKMRYQNPRRPPLDHQNFWLLKHSRGGVVRSSAAVKAWEVVSKIRYIVINRLTEVLRPLDPAVLHFEFVTVNPADSLRIVAVAPGSFDFRTAYVASKGTFEARPPGVGKSRRLLWEGFTPGVRVRKAEKTILDLAIELDKVEYVRFRIGGILIPWKGGQALFSLFTSIRSYPQDEMQDCCYPGTPNDNPAIVFKVPYRLQQLRGAMLNVWQQRSLNYPITSTFDTRLGEEHELRFTFYLAADFKPSKGAAIVLVIRAPVGYEVYRKVASYDVRDSLYMVEDPDVIGGLQMRGLKIDLLTWSPTRVELALPDREELSMELEYQVRFKARTPLTHAGRESTPLWVLEFTDESALANNEVSMNMGAFDDFHLMSQINFTIVADRSPPECVVQIDVVILQLGEVTEFPNRIDVYAPSGYKFLLNCFAPGEVERLKGTFVSCRERWTLFNGQYRSGAVMMAADNGVTPNKMPLRMSLLATTPALTPLRNDFFIQTYKRQGPVAWGRLSDPYPIKQMQVSAQYPGVAGTIVPMFIALKILFPIPWGGYMHISAPLLYKVLCPVTKLLLGDLKPNCTNKDPILNGCFGLPLVTDDDPNWRLPLCDPEHEVLLQFERPAGKAGETEYAIPADTNLLWSISVKVPMLTPTPRSNNVFRFRLLDPNKIPFDGNLDMPGQLINTVPVARNFEMWFTRPVPSSMMTVAIRFTFNTTMPRELESPGNRLRVIQITAPEGLTLAIRRPKDVTSLTGSGAVAISEWNWTSANGMTRSLWFGLDITKNVTGTFHYAFPVLTPSKEQGMPYDNLWDVKFCADAPYCTNLLLKVPIPGFFFGEDPEKPLGEEAQALLTGSHAVRRTSPSLLLQWPVPLLLLVSQFGMSLW
ncbi:unnamed protein product [Polarella glacialis]|uniref:Uncharacterized protein n=1 Tax=Polarella glacialis TaxID=89957 RepID=A0A813GRT7_POLGL|nr:unnamed protein product [Polarella glacialis]